MVAAVAVPSHAASVTFNPGNGNVSISGFNYATSSALATIGAPTAGSTYNVFYESVISGTQGTVVPVGANFNLNNSGNEFTVITGFRERITGITLIPGGGAGGSDAALINFSLASPSTLTNAGPGGTGTPNFFYIFANAPGSANPTTGAGAGFGTGTQVLAGHLTDGFNGSFSENGTITGSGATATFTPSSTPFNTSGQPTAITTPNSVSGGGGTNLNIVVDSFNPAFFPNGVGFLTFQTTNSLPFNGSVAPLSGFYTGPSAAANILYPANFDTGTINGVNGNSLMFTTVASSGFAVPEPAAFVQAATAASLIPMFLCIRRFRSRKTAA